MSKVLDKCPSCGSEIVITRLSCTNCETEVTGSFHTSIFAQLSDDDLQFVEIFLACRGNVKEMERESGLSYWTIRGKLNDIITSLGLDHKKANHVTEKKVERRDILQAVQRGELSVKQAETMLTQLKKRASDQEIGPSDGSSAESD